MIKTLSKAQKMEREKFRIPRSVQDAIPIRRIFADGIFQVGNQYSKTWSFTDINYAIASKEDKTSMFLDYSELLNALDSGASAKITIYNRRINKAEFERSVLLPDKDDGLDEYRHEFNQMLTAQVTGTSNSIVRERYLTVNVVKRNPDEARSYFARVGTDLVTHLAQLSSVATELMLNERLHIFRDFFKAGEQAAAEFNMYLMRNHDVWIYVRCANSDPCIAFDRLYDLIDEAAGHGFLVRGTSFDHCSGNTLKDRIGLRSMLDAVENGRIEAVMVRDLEQISRNSYILVGVIEILRQNDVYLITTECDLNAELINSGLERFVGDRFTRASFGKPRFDVRLPLMDQF